MDGPLGTAPWRRAPVLLLRRPAVFLAIFAATVVLSIAASSGVLFLSTLGTASLQAQARDDCPEASMPQFRFTPRDDHVAAANRVARAVTQRAVPIAHPYTVDLTLVGVQSTQVTLFARAGALTHVQKLTPDTHRAGAWLPQTFAAKLRLQPGDVFTTANNTTIAVAGIYRDLSPDPFHLANLPSYWCTWKDLIQQKLSDGGTPPLLLTDVATITNQFASRDYAVELDVYGKLPLDRLSVDQVHKLEARSTRAYRIASERYPALASVVFGPAMAPERPLRDKTTIAQKVRSGLTGSVLPIDLAATLVALLLVAGAGGFWATHRAREIRLLTSRGVAPWALGVKAALETGPAALVGLLVGVLTARLLVQRVGPTSVFAPGAIAKSALAAAAAVLVGLALVATIGALAARDRGRPTKRAVRWRWLPWEVVLLAPAVWFGRTLHSDSGVRVEHTIVQVRAALVLFPLFGATGALLLLARIGWLVLPFAARVAPRLPAAGYLATRRMARSRAIAVGLLVGTALPCALLTYASTVGNGVHHEITRKYETNLGAPLVLNLIGVHNTTPRLAGHASAIVSYQASDAQAADGVAVTVLGIDPSTFNRFAYATDAQQREVRSLSAGGPAAILVNAPATLHPGSIRIGQTTLPVRVTARSAVFPGLRSGAYPMVVLNRAALATVDTNANRTNQAWTTPAQLPALSRAITRNGYSVLGQVDPDVLVNTTGLLPVTWIFGYLRALAVLVGVVAAAGLVFGLGARTRQRTVAYVMSRRMGMRQGTHVRSLIIELGLTVGVGWLAGVGAGAVGFAIIVSALDIYPALPPGATFALPPSILIGTAAGVVLAVTVAVIATHHFAERADPADILRLE